MDWKDRKLLCMDEMFKLTFEIRSNQVKGGAGTSPAEARADQRSWRQKGLETHGKLGLRKHGVNKGEWRREEWSLRCSWRGRQGLDH